MYAINGERITLDEFYYVHGLKCNMLSTGHLTKKKYSILQKNCLHNSWQVSQQQANNQGGDDLEYNVSTNYIEWIDMFSI